MAADLAALLAARHNIPTVTNVDTDTVLLSVYTGLTVRIDGTRVYWREPDPHHRRKWPRRMVYLTVERAAERLADHYKQLTEIPLGELLANGIVLGRNRDYREQDARPSTMAGEEPPCS
ncbi:hypothetical protein GCM10009560_42930 [Nonomuraea longicatena]|uniref:Uncharacterized protein n=2 Tax=Nonomuraea longicatena TaxID=83682 RepID=A0ABN1PZF2_9ACTN